MAGAVPFNPLQTVTASPAGGLEYSRVQANPDAFGASIGRAETQLGAQLEHSADKVYAAAVDFQKRQDDTDVDAAYSNEFSPKFRNLYQQYYALQGKDAVEGMAPYLTRMKEVQQQTLDSLPNERQKHLFNSLSRRRVEMEMDGMARYADQQNKVYGEQTFNSTLDNLELQAADKHNDEAAFGSALGSIAFTVDKYAAATGKSAEWARDKINERESTAAVSRIQRMMIDAPEEADKWYRANSSMVSPKARPMLEHQLKAAVMPIEIRQKADQIIGPDGDAAIKAAVSGGAPFPAAGPAAGADGVIRVSAPDDATAAKMVKEASDRGQKIDVTVGDATLATPRDTRAMLGTWIAKAEAEYPSDPVKRDALVNQVKARVSTIVAIQNGVQQQAHSTLTKMMMPSNGVKPTTVDELTATPQGAQAWALQSPEAQRGFIAWMDHNQKAAEGKPAQVSARLVQDAFARLYLPPTDPRAITDQRQLVPLIAQGLNPAGFDALSRELESSKTPEGKAFSVDKQHAVTLASQMLTRSMVGQIQPEIALEAGLRFRTDLEARIADYRTKGKDPRDLLTPGKPDYMLTPARVASFLPTGAATVAAEAAKVQGVGPAPEPEKVPGLPTAVNPKTGEKLVYKGGKWQKP